MKYVYRALRYFIFISLLFGLILAVLILTKIVDGNVETLFRNGYTSILQIEAAFFVLSFAYPKLGYVKKGAVIPGEYSQIREQVLNFMKERGYELAGGNGEDLVFRPAKPFARYLSKTDGTITMTRELPGFYVEGPAKDVVRLVSALEYKFNGPAE